MLVVTIILASLVTVPLFIYLLWKEYEEYSLKKFEDELNKLNKKDED